MPVCLTLSLSLYIYNSTNIYYLMKTKFLRVDAVLFSYFSLMTRRWVEIENMEKLVWDHSNSIKEVLWFSLSLSLSRPHTHTNTFIYLNPDIQLDRYDRPPLYGSD